jgi:hypothetical protein
MTDLGCTCIANVAALVVSIDVVVAVTVLELAQTRPDTPPLSKAASARVYIVLLFDSVRLATCSTDQFGPGSSWRKT